MSALALAWAADGRPAPTRLVHAMLASMAHRAPDGVRVWADGSIALGFGAFHTTHEAACEVQPYTAPGGTTVVFDGRIDNRDELRLAIGGIGDSEGDAALVAIAYERWGTDTFRRLAGEFALAVWDSRQPRLVCARDVIGVRPLCYARGDEGTLLAASELRALLDTGCVDDAVNEARALEHLAERGQSRRETLYRHIHRVEPAHVLTIGADGVPGQRPYWDFGGIRDIRYRDPRDYAAHAREVLTTAIRAQARTNRRRAVMLSGGVDSSAVLALAKAAGVPCDAITLTASGLDFDEAEMARLAASACGATLHEAAYVPRARIVYENHAAETLELPPFPNAAMLDPVRALARERGIAVLLSGLGGDEWFSGSPFHYADWIYGLRWIRAARQAGADARRRGVAPVASDVGRLGVWPAVPGPIRRAVRRLRGDRTAMPEWITPAAIARTGLVSRVDMRLTRRAGETYAQADQRAQATAGFYVHALESEDRAAARAGVEQRHPLHDRRVIEFALGLPEEQRWQGPWRKVALRAATEGVLPDRIRLRRDKAEFAQATLDALAGFEHAPLTRIAERGWIDANAVSAMRGDLHAWRRANDVRFWTVLGPVWMCHALECWLTQVTRRNDGSRSRRTPTVA
jgi:asparagine synthase (glutamine-hydrolysing)